MRLRELKTKLKQNGVERGSKGERGEGGGERERERERARERE